MHTPDIPFRVPVTVRMQSGLERTFGTVVDALDFWRMNGLGGGENAMNAPYDAAKGR